MQIFVINGLPGVGKTTFGEIMMKLLEERNFNFLHLSSISLVKDLLLHSNESDPYLYDNSTYLYGVLRKIKETLNIRDFSRDEVFNNKTIESRRAMSSLKSAITEWDGNFLHHWVIDRASKVKERAVIFVDIREPENIEAFKHVCEDYKVLPRTVLIQSDVHDEFDNPSDASVMNYNYDIIIENGRKELSVEESFRKLNYECEKFFKLRILPKNQSGLEIISDNPEYF